MSSALVRYEAARSALAAAHRVDEVKSIRDKAQAMAAYAKQARDTQMIQWATEIKVRAERRCGEMLRELPKNVGGRPVENRSDDATGSAQRLCDLGITKDQSSRYQRLAAMPEEHFEAAVETAKATVGEVTSAHMLRLADEIKKTRQVEEMLATARAELDPVSRANAAWRPVRLALADLHSRIKDVKRLPACPPQTRRELLNQWADVARFVSKHLEQR